MATPALKDSTSGPDVAWIRNQVIDAVSVMFSRAVEHNSDSPEVQDSKQNVEDNPLLPSGPLQDCEFGMVLLLVSDWLGDEFFVQVDRAKYARAVLGLVQSIVSRLLLRSNYDVGGGGNHEAFFTGHPYTQYQRGKKYSANLDAAMIALAFLAPAVRLFNDQLAKADHNLSQREGKLPTWVVSQRDATLFVILEGLKYAQECRVVNSGKFIGFTCDPESNRARPETGGLDREEDRLFFTWTACETINDMIAWRNAYFDHRMPVPAPPEAVGEINAAIDDLNESLHQAAEWCQDAFLQKFGDFQPQDPKNLVREISQLRADSPLGAKQNLVDEMALAVQNVYHLSQYAAIRSLVPQSVTLSEVATIIDKLDLLVTKSILGSRLDDAEHPALFRTLTRQYGLGKSNPEPYADDAWYPLVVRSLSGLLSRTLTDIGTRFSRPEVLALTLTFQRALENHVRNLISRRPDGGDSGPDGKLWSFASGQPYVLYATQRTIFALMKYEEFLVAVHTFQKEDSDGGRREEELSMLFARRFAEFFRPTIRELLAQIQPASLPAVSRGKQMPELPLPEEAWASQGVLNWLRSFTADFNRLQVKAHVVKQVGWLKLAKDTAETYSVPEALPQRKKDGLSGHLRDLQAALEQILGFGDVGQKLSRMSDWDDETAAAILFEYLFQAYMQSRISLEELLDRQPTELWQLIRKAKDSQEAILKG